MWRLTLQRLLPDILTLGAEAGASLGPARLANPEREEQLGPHTLLGSKNYGTIAIEHHDISTHKRGSGTAQLVHCLLATCVWVSKSQLWQPGPVIPRLGE